MDNSSESVCGHHQRQCVDIFQVTVCEHNSIDNMDIIQVTAYVGKIQVTVDINPDRVCVYGQFK
jgi:hypothetical protein